MDVIVSNIKTWKMHVIKSSEIIFAKDNHVKQIEETIARRDSNDRILNRNVNTDKMRKILL